MVSVKQNKIILRSKKLNKEIIPRLSSAHNFSYNALPAYQFLCDMQAQQFKKQGFWFNWGTLSSNYKFLPRAEYRNIIFSRAKWQLNKNDFKLLLDDKVENYTTAIKEWRIENQIPQYIVLAEGDNELFVDLEDSLSLKMFVQTIKKRAQIVIEEFVFDPKNLFIKDLEGNGYTNECIAILLKNKGKGNIISKTLQQKQEPIAEETTQRNFNIGSEWLYYKFYCGVKTADKLLTEVIKPLTEELQTKQLIDKFFFIRYTDPDLHIRLRFHLIDIGNYKLQNLNKLEVLLKAKILGITIPDSYVVSNKNRLTNIMNQNELITKPYHEVVFPIYDGNPYQNYTSEVTNIDFERIEEEFYPTLFQKKIDKLFEIRSFYLFGRFYSMAIFSQQSAKTKLDFRNYNFENPNRTIPINLPIEIEEKLNKLMCNLALNTGAIDLIYSADNKFIFLEINPIGQFGMISAPCNYYLEKLIMDHLIESNGN